MILPGLLKVVSHIPKKPQNCAFPRRIFEPNREEETGERGTVLMRRFANCIFAKNYWGRLTQETCNGLHM